CIRLSCGRGDAAIQAFDTARRLRPGWAPPCLGAGLAAAAARRPPDAARYFSEALVAEPGSTTALLGLAEARERTGDPSAAAAADLRAALALDLAGEERKEAEAAVAPAN